MGKHHNTALKKVSNKKILDLKKIGLTQINTPISAKLMRPVKSHKMQMQQSSPRERFPSDIACSLYRMARMSNTGNKMA